MMLSRHNSSLQVGTWFTYPGGTEGWVDLGYPVMERPGVELATSRLQVRCLNHCTTEPPCWKWVWRVLLKLTLYEVCSVTGAALMFSATFRKRVERVARDILTDPLRVVQGDAGEVWHCTGVRVTRYYIVQVWELQGMTSYRCESD